jgi:hypothetical protein
MGPLFMVRLDNGDMHCRKCEKPVADLSGQSLEQVKHFVASNPGTAWQIVATGDFGGDGRDDILWRGGDGTVIRRIRKRPQTVRHRPCEELSE